MIWLVLTMVGVIVVSWVIIWILSDRAVVKSIGSPTPEEARIDKEADEVTKKIYVGAEAEKDKVRNATAGDLLKRARDELLGKK